MEKLAVVGVLCEKFVKFWSTQRFCTNFGIKITVFFDFEKVGKILEILLQVLGNFLKK